MFPLPASRALSCAFPAQVTGVLAFMVMLQRNSSFPGCSATAFYSQHKLWVLSLLNHSPVIPTSFSVTDFPFSKISTRKSSSNISSVYKSNINCITESYGKAKRRKKNHWLVSERNCWDFVVFSCWIFI